jgi:hypothetical protein
VERYGEESLIVRAIDELIEEREGRSDVSLHSSAGRAT